MNSMSVGCIADSHATPSDKIAAAAPIKHGWFSRLLSMVRWYRRAVTAPETEKKKAEWQQHSF